MAENSIVLKNVTKRFGKSVAVDHLNLEIDANSFVSLLGPSGCGKTTTLRMIAGLETPTEGEIWIGDRLVFSAQKGIDVPPNERGVGFLFQNYALWPHMTVYKNIAFGLENLKWSKADIKKKVDELCELLQLSDFLNRYPSELSGGQQQRVAIARTLATSPQILLMDEPLSNLDAKLRLEMRTELKRLHSTTKATFVYVTHDQLEAMALSTSICLMNTAVLQQYAPPLKIYAEPVNMFVADFVGNPAMNFVDFSLETSGSVPFIRREKETFGVEALQEKELKASGKDVILGIRPEDVKIGSAGKIPGKVISSFPYGMETTVIVECMGTNLRSVVFGSINFTEGQEIMVDLDNRRTCFFHKETKELISLGKISHIKE
ncbi:MAG: ABC transporter ATP-binding protein [Eubacteriales bacterium]|nr:ABC transporter ATP-binding protein [Eubacteriales bacterium]